MLNAAASDSISMNFTAEAAAAVAAAASSDSPSEPRAVPCVGALLRGPAIASHLSRAVENSFESGRKTE